ncbi:hypothetical protein H5410_052725 [Solanum commersonii]|uniref:Uncharacterized protein n=1 Tax=Solanum commersonii TaxID=4109 RepID=A0A9J5X2B4_SOLCO|nr:hypothetical protein H5410_052725 [Solanum commersonii]
MLASFHLYPGIDHILSTGLLASFHLYPGMDFASLTIKFLGILITPN